MPRSWLPLVLSLLTTATFAISSVQAGVITTYSSRPLFTTAVGGTLTIENFTSSSHFPITTGILNSATNLPGIGITPGLIQPGVTYSTPVGSGNFFNIDAGGGYSGGFLDGFNPSNRKLDITFSSPVAGFGFDSGSLGSLTTDVTIHFSSGPDQTFSSAYTSALSFRGFQSSLQDITGVTIANNGGFFGFDLDNFTFGGVGATAIPEPASMTLFGVIAVGGAFYGLRRRKLAAA